MHLQWGDVPTWGLFVGAVATAFYARLAFRKQSEEVKILGQQLADQQELTKQQAAAIKLQSDLLQVQSGQLDLQRRELEQQQVINEKRAEVADLQVQELRESIDQRKMEAVERRRGQASMVWIGEVQELHSYDQPGDPKPGVVARVINESEQPIYNVLISWHLGTQPQGQEPIGVLMPHSDDSRPRRVPDGATPDRFGAVVFFHDAAGVCWRRRPDGQLDEIPAGQEPPHTW